MAAAVLPVQDLQSKVAIVTGASRGIGKAIALHLASRGASILGTGSSESSVSLIQALAAENQTRHPNQSSKPKFVGVVADILDPENSPAAIVKALIEHFSGKANILINNAAIGGLIPLDSVTQELTKQYFTANVFFPMALISALLPHIQPHSRIVNISSVAVRFIGKNNSVYAATKAAIESLTRSWAAELGRREGMEGTTVNALEPGPTKTDMWAALDEEVRDGYEAQMVGSYLTPQGRIAVPEDLTPYIAFLTSEASAWTTAAVFEVSSGSAVLS